MISFHFISLFRRQEKNTLHPAFATGIFVSFVVFFHFLLCLVAIACVVHLPHLIHYIYRYCCCWLPLFSVCHTFRFEYVILLSFSLLLSFIIACVHNFIVLFRNILDLELKNHTFLSSIVFNVDLIDQNDVFSLSLPSRWRKKQT